MSKYRISFQPNDLTIEAPEMASLLEVARKAGFVLSAECGGQGTCRRCKVKLLSGDLFISGDQNLSDSERDQQIVLACMARIDGDASIEILPESELRYDPGASDRELEPQDHPGDNKAMILNETLVKQLGWEEPIGKTVLMTDVAETGSLEKGFVEVPYTVIGVVRDFHFESLHEKIRGHLMKMSGEVSRISVKIRPGTIAGTLQSIENIWREIEPAHPFSYVFLDDSFDRLYRSEQRMGQIFISFTLMAIFISCLGLFGLASFTADQRTKEIGIRKVLGASVSNVVLLLSKDFTKWVILANVVAWPVAYLVMAKWLQNFAYRISLAVWMFILSGVIALIIAVLTVSTKALRAAAADPVNSLRYE